MSTALYDALGKVRPSVVPNWDAAREMLARVALTPEDRAALGKDEFPYPVEDVERALKIVRLRLEWHGGGFTAAGQSLFRRIIQRRGR